MPGWVCPAPLRDTEHITMAHGGGGRLTSELVEHLEAERVKALRAVERDEHHSGAQPLGPQRLVAAQLRAAHDFLLEKPNSSAATLRICTSSAPSVIR